MNRKIFTLAVAATLMVPMATYADVKLSGVIQAEGGGAKIGQVDGIEADNVRLSNDTYGALANAGPNRLRFDVDEKLGGDLSAYGRYQAPFNTATNTGLGQGQEAWVGLKAPSFYLRFGKIEGVYKVSKQYLDPFAATAIQSRGTAGGMSGSSRLEMAVKDAAGKVTTLSGLGLRATKVGDKYTVTSATGAELFKGVSLLTNPIPGTTNHLGLSNSGEVNNTLEIGVKFGDFSASAQGVFDQSPTTKDQMDGAGLFELKYSMPMLTVFASGTYVDLKKADSDARGKSSLRNWKVGGQAKVPFGPNEITVGLEYEEAEMGAFDPNPKGGKYILGSLDYKLNNVAIGGWVAQYSSKIKEADEWDFGQGKISEDALNWAVGVKYWFSTRTMAYLGYLQTDSDNNYRDQKIYGAGLRHSF